MCKIVIVRWTHRLNVKVDVECYTGRESECMWTASLAAFGSKCWLTLAALSLRSSVLLLLDVLSFCLFFFDTYHHLASSLATVESHCWRQSEIERNELKTQWISMENDNLWYILFVCEYYLRSPSGWFLNFQGPLKWSHQSDYSVFLSAECQRRVHGGTWHRLLFLE